MNWLQGSLRIGSLFGIEIRLHSIFLIFLAFSVVTGGVQELPDTLLFFSILFTLVLLHELGHCFGARSVGGDAPYILLWPLGGLAYASAPQRPWPQFVTIAAGPLVNVIFCIVAGAVLVARAGTFGAIWFNPLDPMLRFDPSTTTLIAWRLYQLNLLLLVFNLLPIYPLDGGQILRTMLWPWLGIYRATVLSCQVGIAGAIGLGLLGFFELQQGGSLMLILIAGFIGFESFRILQATQQGFIIEDPPTRVRVKRRQAAAQTARRVNLLRRKPVPSAEPPLEASSPDERAAAEAELDRILAKVHERGISSLTYVEQQKLQRATQSRRHEP